MKRKRSSKLIKILSLPTVLQSSGVTEINTTAPAITPTYVDKSIPMPTYLPDAERTARTKELLKLYQQNREGSQL